MFFPSADTLTAYQYVQKAGGMATEAEYPETSYKTGKSGTCKRFAHPTVGTIDGHTFATPECATGACNKQDEDTMVANVARYVELVNADSQLCPLSLLMLI